ncbi:rhodanese-like domain-containing protein [Hyphobacterium sp. CCMP332]|nr:rhodanese-like domain-containing protein [Hyphobacterium sp. CCMP332]
MKHLTFITILVIVNSFSCQVNGQNIKVLDPKQYEASISEIENVQLVDIRTPKEYNQGHILGSENINFYDSDFETRMLQLDKSKPVMLYCASGGRSANASDKLSKLGFTQIIDLKGGIRAWTAAGKTIAKD